MEAAATLADRANWRARRGAVYAATGQRARAARILAELESGTETVSPVTLAILCVALGERDRAIALLARARTERDPDFVTIGSEPAFDPVREDPRVHALLSGRQSTP